MKKSLLILLPIISCSVTTAAVAQETLAQVRITSQINSIDTIEAFEQLTIRSIVVSVNNRDRTIVLQGEDRARYDLNFGRDFKAFDTVKVGDQLTGQLTRKIIIEPDAVSNAVGTINYTVQRSVSGDDVDKSITQVSIFNAEIMRVDINNYTVTFVNPDGTSRTVAVSNPRLQARLASLKQGQKIRVQIDTTFQIVDTATSLETVK